MRLENITWPQAEHYFKENDMVIVPIGSVECHGRHLPLGTDNIIPNRILELIEEKSDILITPMIPYGACESLQPFPGTVNLGGDVLYILLDKVVENLYSHGARKILFLNGHGGNIKTIERVGFKYEKMGAIVVMLNWWLMAWELNPAWKGGHGGGEETAGVMGVDPSLVDYSELTDEPLKLKDISDTIKASGFRSVEFKGVNVDVMRSTPNVTDNGWIGPDHPTTATEEWGKEMLQASADYIVEFAEEFKKVDLKDIIG